MSIRFKFCIQLEFSWNLTLITLLTVVSSKRDLSRCDCNVYLQSTLYIPHAKYVSTQRYG